MIKKTYSREFAPSPIYMWSNADDIADDLILNVDWGNYNTTTKKYLPFNLTRIINNGEADIYFYPNQNTDQAFFIPKGTITTIDSSTIPALSSFSIKRATATTISAGKIIINCSREGQTADNIIGRIHRDLFSKKSSRVV